MPTIMLAQEKSMIARINKGCQGTVDCKRSFIFFVRVEVQKLINSSMKSNSW